MNALIWYSWLGGIIIGTMIGANLVLEEYCRAGPRVVVITGRYLTLSPLSNWRYFIYSSQFHGSVSFTLSKSFKSHFFVYLCIIF